MPYELVDEVAGGVSLPRGRGGFFAPTFVTAGLAEVDAGALGSASGVIVGGSTVAGVAAAVAAIGVGVGGEATVAGGSCARDVSAA